MQERRIQFQLDREPIPWLVDEMWKVGDLITNLSNRLEIRDPITLCLYGSILEEEAMLSDVSLLTDIIQVCDESLRPLEIEFQTEENQQLNDDEFILYTTYTKQSMIRGNKITLDFYRCHDFESTKRLLKEKIRDTFGRQDLDFDIIIKLAGGLLYQKGTIQEFMQAFETPKHVIYVDIIENSPTDKQLTVFMKEKVEKIWLIDEMNKLCYSPLSNLSDDEYNRAAAALGVLANTKSNFLDKLLAWCEVNVNYTPLIVALYDLQRRFTLQRHQLITICFAFTTIVKSITRDQNIWLHIIELFNYIESYNIKYVGSFWTTLKPFITGSKAMNYLHKYFDPKEFYYVTIANIDFTTSKVINKIIQFPNESNLRNAQPSTFEIRQLGDLNNIYDASIFRRSGKLFIYLRPTTESVSETIENQVQILNPFSGELEMFDAEACARNQNQNSVQNSDRVTQVNIVCVDTSKTMTPYIGAARIVLEQMSLSAFKYGIPSSWGVYTFDDKPNLVLPISDLASEFHDQVNVSINQNSSSTHLFDAIETAAAALMNSNYKNAIKRIIAITDGKDTEYVEGRMSSKQINQKLKEITNILLNNNIILDIIFFNNGDARAAHMCDFTGGMPFLFNKNCTASDALEFFSGDGFFNASIRQFEKRKIPESEPFTRDKKILNRRIKIDVKDLINQKVDPLHTAIDKMDRRVNNGERIDSRLAAILLNLKDIACMQRKCKYIEVFTKEDDCSHWAVFIKTDPDDINYKGRYLKLIVTFPAAYPSQPPSIRFVNVPDHQNISKDGSMVINLLRRGYSSKTTIFNILKRIRSLITKPEPRNILRPNASTNPTKAQSISKETLEEFLQSDGLTPNPTSYNVDVGEQLSISDEFIDPFLQSRIEQPVRGSNGLLFELNSLTLFFRPVNNQYAFTDPRTGEEVTIPYPPVLDSPATSLMAEELNSPYEFY